MSEISIAGAPSREAEEQAAGGDGHGTRARAIDVAFTRAEIRPASVAVVIDVLRATSTIAQALHAGYRRVLCTPTLDAAKALGGEGRVLAGERESVPPPGFELGNSPGEVEAPRGTELVLSTTNGSPTIVEAAANAEKVLLGSVLNLRALIEAIPADDLLLACCGTEGSFGLEDLYLAGRISAELDGTRSDAAIAAECVSGAYASPLEALRASAHSRTLGEAGLWADVERCAEESVIDTVPVVTAIDDDVAVIESFAGQA